MSHEEEGADLPEYDTVRGRLLFQGVYGDFPHHNDISHLDGGVLDDAM